MSKTRKTFQELSLLDDYLSTAMAADEKYNKKCFKRILSVLLEKDISQIEVIAQRVIPGKTSEYRGIRMDVEIKETDNGTVMNVYDIEPHKRNNLHFPRHNRFYSAKIDGRYVQAGLKDFSNMPNLYIITITDFDIFGKGSMIYRFHMKCDEYPDLEYDDGLQMIYFNTKGKNGGSQSIKNMLSYIQDSEVENAVDDATREIHSYVESIKRNSEWEADYMTLGDIIDLEIEESKEGWITEGKAEAICDVLNDIGNVPEDLKEKILRITDNTMLVKLLKIACKATSIQQFAEEMKQVEAETV